MGQVSNVYQRSAIQLYYRQIEFASRGAFQLNPLGLMEAGSHTCTENRCFIEHCHDMLLRVRAVIVEDVDVGSTHFGKEMLKFGQQRGVEHSVSESIADEYLHETQEGYNPVE